MRLSTDSPNHERLSSSDREHLTVETELVGDEVEHLAIEHAPAQHVPEAIRHLTTAGPELARDRDEWAEVGNVVLLAPGKAPRHGGGSRESARADRQDDLAPAVSRVFGSPWCVPSLGLLSS